MGGIIQLDHATSDLIAAGEVIEGPFSVVRELWDNAIDAGARRVRIELIAGGTAVIRVADDGSGMDCDDAVRAFSRHATSKIAGIDDLWQVTSLGFRGEALPSIAAVARVELITCQQGAVAGTRIVAAGAKIESCGDIGAPPGTTVIVSDLFFNTPARRKSLNNPTRELTRCLDLLRARSAARPDVATSVTHNGRAVWAVSGGGARAVFGELSGYEVSAQLVEVDAADGVHRIRGFAGRPAAHRGSRSLQYLVVNGRPVVLPRLTEAVESVYRSLLPTHRHPVFALYLDIPGAEVDINVHPAKTEVRIRDEAAVCELAASAVRETLRRARLIAAAAGVPAAAPSTEPAAYPGYAPTELQWGEREREREREREAQADIADDEIDPDRIELGRLEVLGQVADSFIVCASEHGLYVIDQHAAHERVYYDQLTGDRGAVSGQLLLVPETVRVGQSAVELAVAHASLLVRSGFDIEPFGEDTLIVRATPPGFELAAAIRILEDTLRHWEEGRKGPGGEQSARAALAACKAAVKANAVLTREEMTALVQLLAASDNPTRCAHGRPTVLHYDLGDLRRRFGRQ